MKRFRRAPALIREQAPLLILIATMFAIWLGGEIAPDDWTDAFRVVPANISESWRHVRAGSFGSAELGDFATLFSYAFFHGDIEHVFFNMLYLWIFAALVGEYLGQRLSALIFFLTAVAGGFAHTLLDPTDTTPMLGASGALMGFEGAYLGLALRHQLPDPHIWPMAHPIPPYQLAALAVIGIVFDFHDVFVGQADFVAHGAHIGGFVMGFFITSVALPALPGRHRA